MASPNTHRNKEVQALDFYTSPIDFVNNIHKYLIQNSFHHEADNIWEPSVGTGKVALPLIESGFKVYSSDIYDYGFPNTEVKDFFSYNRSAKRCKCNCNKPPV